VLGCDSNPTTSDTSCQVSGWLSTGFFGLEIGFTDQFNTQLITTLNYSAIANFPTLHFTRAHAKYFPTRSVFTSSCSVTALVYLLILWLLPSNNSTHYNIRNI
jgi:hypothetical protein